LLAPINYCVNIFGLYAPFAFPVDDFYTSAIMGWPVYMRNKPCFLPLVPDVQTERVKVILGRHSNQAKSAS